MYENIIAKSKNTKDWLKYSSYNIGVKQCCPLFPTLFSIHIDKLEDCLEKLVCIGPNLTGIVISILIYADDIFIKERSLHVDDIFLMQRSPHDLENQLRILKDF